MGVSKIAIVFATCIGSGSALSLNKVWPPGMNEKGDSPDKRCLAIGESVMDISFVAQSSGKDCQEPKNPEKDIEGLGLTRVYCCGTAKEKVTQLKVRQTQCANEDISVPCWKSLKKVLPSYIEYYTKLGNELCPTPFPTEAPANGTNGSFLALNKVWPPGSPGPLAFTEAKKCQAFNASVMDISFAAQSSGKDCNEPKNPEKDIEGLGLTRVYCCETAKEKVAQLKVRQGQCANSDISVPCWKSLKKVLPSYIEYYTKLGNEICPTPFPTEAPANGTNNTTAF